MGDALIKSAVPNLTAGGIQVNSIGCFFTLLPHPGNRGRRLAAQKN